jgi:hypothetical protein
VNEIKIQIFEPESIPTRLESRFNALGSVIGVPQLCGNKNFFASDPSRGKSRLQRLTHLALVSVSFSAIEMSKSDFQCISGRSDRPGCVGNEGAKAERGQLAATLSGIFVIRISVELVIVITPCASAIPAAPVYLAPNLQFDSKGVIVSASAPIC